MNREQEAETNARGVGDLRHGVPTGLCSLLAAAIELLEYLGAAAFPRGGPNFFKPNRLKERARRVGEHPALTTAH